MEAIGKNIHFYCELCKEGSMAARGERHTNFIVNFVKK